MTGRRTPNSARPFTSPEAGQYKHDAQASGSLGYRAVSGFIHSLTHSLTCLRFVLVLATRFSTLLRFAAGSVGRR